MPYYKVTAMCDDAGWFKSWATEKLPEAKIRARNTILELSNVTLQEVTAVLMPAVIVYRRNGRVHLSLRCLEKLINLLPTGAVIIRDRHVWKAQCGHRLREGITATHAVFRLVEAFHAGGDRA